jgi:ribonuclease R
MLPEVLSNGICSLNPGVERMCMVCDMQIDRHGDTTGARFYPAVMRSAGAPHVHQGLACAGRA